MKYIFVWSMGFLTTTLLAQGAAVIMPLSKALSVATEVVSFDLFNRLESALTLSVSIKCDVNGQELEGIACDPYFEMTPLTPLDSDSITIPQNGKWTARVRLKDPNIEFAIFKPLFVPQIKDDSQNESTVRFDLAYQPGYLWVLKPSQKELKDLTFSTYALQNSKRAKFVFSLKELDKPQVWNLSAKILEASNGQLVRFIRLANDKILDPKRQEMTFEGEYAQANDDREVCYELFVENVLIQKIYKIGNCTPKQSQLSQ
jgi:hypothetical protein